MPPRVALPIVRLRRLAMAVALAVVASRPAVAQSCTVASSRVALERFSGMTIDSLRIDALPPHPPRVLGSVLAPMLRMRARTRPATIRRELLLAPGDTVDTLRVAESLRRLRALGYLDDVEIEGRRCAPSSGVALTLHTRDRWSESAVLRVRSRSTGVVLREENLGGTGRAVRLGVATDRTGVSATASVHDPALFGGRFAGQLSLARYGNGSLWSAALGTRRRSLEELWIADLDGMTSEREPRTRVGSIFQRTATSLDVGRRVTPIGAPSMVALLVGAETDRADLSASSSEPIVGPAAVSRSYAGLTLGLIRRAARYDTVTWLLPGEAIVDLPRGVESDLLVGAGRDMRAGRGAVHLDAWAGRLWRPMRDALVIGDVWSSGYAGDDLLDASTLRASVTALRAASRGLWIARVSGERLIQPDPDVRALATTDPTVPLLPSVDRLSESALAGWIERDVHVRPLTSSLMLDAAAFGAVSYRTDPALPSSALGVTAPADGESGAIGLAAIGLGLRVVPTRHASTTIRLDAGWSVAGPASLAHRPYVAITFSPWLLGDRHRDGRVTP